MESAKSRATNFSGSWQDTCPHCGLAQSTHRQLIDTGEGEIVEYRRPCPPEREALRRGMIARVRMSKLLILVFWILVPLAILILEFTNPLIGKIAFGLALAKLALECFKFFGNPNKWIPGHAAKAEKQRKMEHYFYHCERNPDGFSWLRAENFDRDEA